MSVQTETAHDLAVRTLIGRRNMMIALAEQKPAPLYTLSLPRKIGRLLLELVKFSIGREQ